MSLIVTRLGKGSPLTNLEIDSNFNNLNSDKLEVSAFVTTANSWLDTKTLNHFADVAISTPVDGQSLVWNAASSKWENQTPAGGTTGLEGGSVHLTTSGSATLDQFSASLYTTIKYLVQATSGNDLHVSEVTLVHNGSNVYLSEYGTFYTASELVTFDSTLDTNTGLIDLSVTPINVDTYVDFKRISITSRIGSTTITWTYDGDLSTLSGTEDLMSGTGTIDLMADSTPSSTLEGDIMSLTGAEDLMSGTGIVDLMDLQTFSLQGDVMTLTGTEDLSTGSGTSDLLV